MKRPVKLSLTIVITLIVFVAFTVIGYVPLLALSEIYDYSIGVVVSGALLLGVLTAVPTYRILWKKLPEHRP